MEMSGRGLDPRDIGAVFSVGTTGVMTDAALLERFVDRDREASQLAFAELVARHSPMVLRVCQTILHDAHDAEDAFQATFLVSPAGPSRFASERRRPVGCMVSLVALRCVPDSPDLDSGFMKGRLPSSQDPQRTPRVGTTSSRCSTTRSRDSRNGTAW